MKQSRVELEGRRSCVGNRVGLRIARHVGRRIVRGVRRGVGRSLGSHGIAAGLDRGRIRLVTRTVDARAFASGVEQSAVGDGLLHRPSVYGEHTFDTEGAVLVSPRRKIDELFWTYPVGVAQ